MTLTLTTARGEHTFPSPKTKQRVARFASKFRTQVAEMVSGVRARWAAGARTAGLQIAGFGFISAAAWAVAMPLGLLTVGVSFLVIEALGGKP